MNKKTSVRSASAKKLLTLHALPMDSATLNNGLILAGILEIKTYISTTGSGELKNYLAFTTAGMAFGKNSASGWHEIKTEPSYFENEFANAYLLAAEAILTHGQAAFK